MSAETPSMHTGAQRLLWLVVVLVLLYGALTTTASALLPGIIQKWLAEHGMEAQIDYIELSLPRLYAELRGVQVHNRRGRGMRAGEITFGFSWLRLLRGQIYPSEVALEGVHLDMQSFLGERGRVWEIGGWELDGGSSPQPSWSLELTAVSLRNSEVCYRHKPQWDTASCVWLGELELQDFLIKSDHDEKKMLQLEIGAQSLHLESLIARDLGDQGPTLALVELQITDGQFVGASNRLTASGIESHKFTACPPQRWAEALPALGVTIGHCAAARQLQVKGPIALSFDDGAQLQWHQASGQRLTLRYANRSLPNWSVETIALNRFDYQHNKQRLHWQSGDANTFDWCPEFWRTEIYHYCVRAASLRLPDMVTFNWQQQFSVITGSAALLQTQLLDLANEYPGANPVSANHIDFSALAYRGDQRLLEVSNLSLDVAAGCISGQLWQGKAHCVQLKQFLLGETAQLYLPLPTVKERVKEKSKTVSTQTRGWGFSSGDASLESFKIEQQISSEATTLLELNHLGWQKVNLISGAAPWLIQDFYLQKLRGCVPEILLTKNLQPLCAELDQLVARGSFSLYAGDQPYMEWGGVSLASLRLSDQLLPGRGLQLDKLKVGNGFFRREINPGNPASMLKIFNSSRFAKKKAVKKIKKLIPPGNSSAAKGQLADEEAPEVVADYAATDDAVKPAAKNQTKQHETDSELTAFNLQYLSLSRLEGCLPAGWAYLFYQQRKQRPECFRLENVRQSKPLALRWGRGLTLAAAEVAIQHAQIMTASGTRLLQIEHLRVPRAAIELGVRRGHNRFILASIAVNKFNGCLNKSTCMELQTLRTGEDFSLRVNQRRFAANFSGLVLDRLKITTTENTFNTDIRHLSVPQLNVQLSRTSGTSANWVMNNVRAKTLEFCWPALIGHSQTTNLSTRSSRLPRCVSGKNLRSYHRAGESGLALEQLQVRSAPEAPIDLALGKLQLARVALAQSGSGPLKLNLHNLQIDDLDGCGLRNWLPVSVLHRGWGGCLRGQQITLSGDNLITLGKNDSRAIKTGESETARLELGPLRASALALLDTSAPSSAQETVKTAQVRLQQLNWQALRWLGGAQLQVTAVDIRQLSGCLPKNYGNRQCFELSQLALPGSQQLTFSQPLHSNGKTEIRDFAYRQGSERLVGFSRMTVNGLTFADQRLSLRSGEITGINGCLPAFKLGKKILSPCYQVGRITTQSGNNIQLSGTSKRQLRNIVVEGLQVRQAGLLKDGSAQLLQIKKINADALTLGRDIVAAENLQFTGVKSCIPAVHIKDSNYCLTLGYAYVSGGYRFSSAHLELKKIELNNLDLKDYLGQTLFQANLAAVENLKVNSKWIEFLNFELAGSKFSQRHVQAEEFAKHQWNGELERLRIYQLKLDKILRNAQINSIELIRPKAILNRGYNGDIEFIEAVKYNKNIFFGYNVSEHKKNGSKIIVNKFDYYVGKVLIDKGRLLWIDKKENRNARLMTKNIHILLLNANNYLTGKPSVLLANAYPGGLGELQMAGTVNFKDTQLWGAKLLGYLDSVNLIPATPYIAQMLGYKILQGQIDSVMDIKVADNQVDAKSNMILNKIKIRRLRNSDKLSDNRSFIPLNVALLLLKDGQGNVKFDFPITGDLYDPEFSYKFVLNELLQRAIFETLFSYFTPVGIYSLAKFAWARFRTVDFSSVLFEPGDFKLSVSAREELEETVIKMKINPDARPGICGVSTALDLQALYPNFASHIQTGSDMEAVAYLDPPQELRKKMQRLASKRSRQVQKFFIKSGLSADQFIQCSTDYLGDDKTPRVEISN